jgi:hypothetical protein
MAPLSANAAWIIGEAAKGNMQWGAQALQNALDEQYRASAQGFEPDTSPVLTSDDFSRMYQTVGTQRQDEPPTYTAEEAQGIARNIDRYGTSYNPASYRQTTSAPVRPDTPYWTDAERQAAAAYNKQVASYRTAPGNRQYVSGPVEPQDQVPGFIPREDTPFWTAQEQEAAAEYARTGGHRFDPARTTVSAPSTPTPVGPWAQPMPGYVQFEPGGAIYEMGDYADDPSHIYRNQHLFAPVPQMKWADDFGVAPFDPGATAMFGTGAPYSEPLPAGYTPRGWQPPAWNAPGLVGQRNEYARILEARRIAENQRRIADALGIPYDDAGYFSGYGGGYGGGGYSRSPYYQQPYYSSAPPVVVDPVTGYQQQSVVTEGEPSFSQDPYPSDPFIKFPDVGMGVLPVDARNRLNTWLQGLGYDPQGVIGTYGQTDYIRPEGYEGPLQFGEADYATIEDPTIRQWIQWLMGEMGYSPQITYPGAAA